MSTYNSVRTVQYHHSGHHSNHQSGFGNLVSGMSSAGAICTTALRDTREREKREIGMLNDRLADYIEKVRFLKAQNHCLEHDIEILRRGFTSSGHVSHLFESEISSTKVTIEKVLAARTAFQSQISALSSEIETYRTKWLDALKLVRAHRADHDVNLDQLAKIEAEVSIYTRKIRIVEEDVHRVRRENDLVLSDIGRIRGLVHSEVSLKSERSRNVQELLQRVQYLQTDNAARIEQELVYIRRDTTAENRDYFRHELQSSISDIRADYEARSYRHRQEIEAWYQTELRKIREYKEVTVNINLYKDELVHIRSTMSTVTSQLAQIESRNTLLVSQISELKHQQTEESRIFESQLSERDKAIQKLRERCTELSIQMEKLCDHEISLQAELERYRVLLNGANVTTYLSSNTGHQYTTGGVISSNTGHQYSTGGVISSSHTSTIRSSGTTSSTATTVADGGHRSLAGVHISGNLGGVSVGGHVGGYSVGGNIGGSSQVSRSSAAHSYSYSASSSQ